MKTRKIAITFLSAMLFVSGFIAQGQAAQPARAKAKEAYLPKKTLQLALRGYEDALRVDLSSTIATSGVFQAMRFKLAYPNLNYSKIISALIRVSLQAEAPELRHNAQVTACVMANPEAYLSAEEIAQLSNFTEETREDFFALLNAKVLKTATK